MNENVKAADLIGKVIVINGTDKYYKVLGVDGDKLLTEFHIGEGKDPMSVPLPMANLQGFLEKNVWSIESEATATETKATETKSEDEVEEVSEVVPPKHEPTQTPKDKAEEPKAKPKKKEEPKAKQEKPKAEPKPKQQKTKPEVKADGKLTYETYQSKKGKTCAKISGFAETDAAYKEAESLHGSASWDTTKDGRVLYIAFGPRYAEAAKQVCDALNAGKTLADCKAIVDKATEERAAKREEWKQKREEKKAAAADKPANTEGKTYTEAEVLDLLKRVADGDKDALAMVDAMAKAAA